MFRNGFNIKIMINKYNLLNGFREKLNFNELSVKRMRSSQSSQQLVPRMESNTKSMDLNEDIYSDKNIPAMLLRAGQAIWRFKRYFGQLKPKRPPISSSFHEKSGEWSVKIHILEPKEIIFTAKSNTKRAAESLAMAKSLLWMRDNNLVDHSFNPIHSTSDQIKSFNDKMNASLHIKPIDQDLKYQLNYFIESFNQNTKESIIKICRSFDKNLTLNCDKDWEESDSAQNEEILNENFDPNESHIIRNVLTSVIYEEPNDYELHEREEALKLLIERRMKREKTDRNFAELRHKVSNLPIAEFREEIIETIQQNRVVVISGDTGCGKTTQVPQYIFENEINKRRGAFANIVVTQPRRISAISMSERVALEFGEESVGNTIGYNVRFDKSLPDYNNGAMLFCTAGILLRKLERNPKLKGVSHVIIDEVHERDVIIDFLLVLLKRVLRVNPDIRIILMSASMNAHLFVNYFDSCPSIEIPGRCFPVEQFYLNDFSNKIGVNNLREKFLLRNPKIDKDIIIRTIDYINRNKSDGAILVFLPGWGEIQDIQRELLFLNQMSNNLLIIPIHSKLPHNMQRQIFAKTPVGVRKVVLATNIAETSLTIDDVVYVLDPGLANEMRYSADLNVSAFGTHWISKANAKQRSGRAGRVKAGECYKFYPKEIENSFMEDFPTPELLRIPLESVVMQAKLHCPYEEVQQFLSEVPQSPSNDAIQSAVNSLKEIKVLDDRQNLTNLGKRIVNFSTHPRLSVSLVYSSMFGCLTSMLSLVSHLSANRNPFQVMPDQKAIVRAIKREFSFETLSDHISLVHMTNEFNNISNTGDKNELNSFCEENHLSRYAMNNILETKKLFASHLEESNFIEKNSWKNVKSSPNCNWHQKQLLITSLIPGLIPNYIRLFGGQIKNNKINWHKISPIDINTGKKVKFSSDSILCVTNYGEKVEQIIDNIILYFGSFFSIDARMLTICDASLISPKGLLLFSDNKFEFDFENISNLSKDECIVILRNNNRLKFIIRRDDLKIISQFNEIINLYFQWFLVPKNLKNSNENENIENSLKQFIQLINDLMIDNSQAEEEEP